MVAWAKTNLTTNAYSVIYKRQGEDKSHKKIEKPTITPISANRDAQSDYLLSIQQSEVAPIAPVFVDYERDMSRTNLANGTEVLYKQNETNDLFSLIYLYDFGAANFKSLPLATSYMELLGTAEKSAEQIQRELYDLACTFNISTSVDKTYIVITGLTENMEKAMQIAEDYIANVKGDDAVLREVKRDAEQERLNAKSSQQSCFGALQQYCIYGAEYARKVKMSNKELQEVTSEELLSQIKNLQDIEHRVMYYGPKKLNDLTKSLQEVHCTNKELQKVEKISLSPKDVKEQSVLFAQYDAKQIYYMQFSCREQDKFNIKNTPIANLYNSYFSGGMNSIVFQEMREARGLAYSAYAGLFDGKTPKDPYYFYAFIATQNDKVQQAVEAFDEIIEEMPRSDKAFDLAKSGLLANLESKRTTKANVLWGYLEYEKFGLKEDINKTIYEGVKNLTLDDVVTYQQSFIKGRPYTYCILGDKRDLDMKYIGSLGKIKYLSQEEIFGY